VTEGAIIDGIRSGDQRAAEELLAMFESSLVRYFQAALPNIEAAEDAAQETFIRLIESIRSGRTKDVRSLAALIFTIARRLAIDIGRQSARRPSPVSMDAHPGGDESRHTLADVIPASGDDPREMAIRRERDAQVQDALRALEPEVREVITLRHIDGLSSREVAEILGVAEGTVWSRLHRGLEVLRGHLTARKVTASSTTSRKSRS